MEPFVAIGLGAAAFAAAVAATILRMIAYVDESGDLGTRGRGSRWFVLGCAAIKDADAAATREAVKEGADIAGQPDPGRLHFTSMSHDNKMGTLELLADAPWTGIIVASDTTKIHPRSALADPTYHYNYTARYMIERVSRLAAEVNEPATVYFERRKGAEFSKFLRYIEILQSRGDLVFESARLTIDRIMEMPKGNDPLLCVADGLAHACFRALEPDRRWKRLERSYLNALLPRIWRGPSNAPDIHRWGMTLTPTRRRESFMEEHPWIKTLGA